MWVNNVLFSIGTLCILYLIKSSECYEIIFQRNNDFYDKRNWLGHVPQKKCQGLFLEQFYGTTTFKTLEIEQMVFGKLNDIILNDDTEIIFDDNTKSEMNCVAINGSEVELHQWTNFDNWLKSGVNNDNMAIPHLEKLPCVYDDVIFPKGYLSGAVVISSQVSIKSFKFGDEYYEESEFVELDSDSTLSNIIVFVRDGEINVNNRQCDDDSGCVCGNELYYGEACDVFDVPDTIECNQPILPIGFCYKICGSTIIFEPKQDFEIARMETRLKSYTSDTHISKVKNENGDEVIQIIFTEKQFTGNSIEEAQRFHQILKDDKTIEYEKSEFLTSSYPNQNGKNATNAISIIFGSLFSACVIFAMVLYLFGDNDKTKRFRERVGLGSRPLTYKSVFFSRNSSISEGTGLIGEGHLVGSSMPNIPKTFENPSFSEFTKKSSSTSSSNASSAEDLTKETGLLKKPNDLTEPQVFEEQTRRHLIETVAEEGELVDLSDMS
ncbi:uncharacterized protein LOC130902556 [Diorhabda carinulata]|uniref:uncharacterized protein LOC130902556 n=1 Tax=Diorhabda carinulata TaxID=1163345 RepID=UPI0025A1264B|nr:uncharacterized protein LOC130902556 [Diorhabda carinulata]